MEQMCSYCETFFVVPEDEHGVLDMCPGCYQEYAPWIGGTERDVREGWKTFQGLKLAEGIEPSLLQSLFKTWRAEYRKRFGKYPEP